MCRSGSKLLTGEEFNAMSPTADGTSSRTYRKVDEPTSLEQRTFLVKPSVVKCDWQGREGTSKVTMTVIIFEWRHFSYVTVFVPCGEHWNKQLVGLPKHGGTAQFGRRKIAPVLFILSKRSSTLGPSDRKKSDNLNRRVRGKEVNYWGGASSGSCGSGGMRPTGDADPTMEFSRTINGDGVIQTDHGRLSS